MAPDFKIQSREHIRILGDGFDDRLNGYNIFNNFRIGSEDFKYSDEFKKYLRENINNHSKSKKEAEEDIRMLEFDKSVNNCNREKK